MARTSAKAKKQKQVGSNTQPENASEAAPSVDKEENSSAKNQEGDDSTDKENDVNYEVEKIVHTRVYRRKKQYLIRWKGYGEDNDTWENESVLQSCQEALDAFQKEEGKLKDESDNDGDDEESTRESTEVQTNDKNKSPEKKVQNKSKRISKAKNNIETPEEKEDSGEEMKSKEIKIINNDNQEKKKMVKGRKKDIKDNETEEPVKKKKKEDVTSDESVTDGKNYEVEKILEVHFRKDGSREFLIRWKGYKPSDDTWEPEEHLECPELIEKFMEKVQKAKSIPARQLREARTVNRLVPHQPKTSSRTLRNTGRRPFYQE